MTRYDLQLKAALQRDLHLGTGRYTGQDLYVPLEEMKKTSTHVVGAAGYGKSRMLMNLIRQFIRFGQPFAIIEPHRELVEFALSALRRSSVSKEKVVLLDPGDSKYSIAFNPLYCGITDPGIASSLVLESCQKAWGTASFDSTPRLERILRDVFRMLVENRLSLVEAPEVLNIDNTSLRLALRDSVSDPLVRQDWAEFEKWPRAEKLAIVESSQNRLRRFIQSEQVQLMLGQCRNTLNLQHVLDVRVLLSHRRLRDVFRPFEFFRINVFERRVFEPSFHFAHAEPVRDRRENFQTLQRHAILFLRRDRVERFEIVKPVREFDDDDAHVFRDREEHLA